MSQDNVIRIMCPNLACKRVLGVEDVITTGGQVGASTGELWMQPNASFQATGLASEDGFLAITGRKKDIIITAGGKNITPANLEAEIKQNRWVSQCVVVGDRQPYLVALVTLDPEEAAKYAAENNLPNDPAVLATNEGLKAEIEAHVDEINKKFARVEQVKKIAILPQDLSQETGELTPTMKVKRNVVCEKYADEIEALYK